MNPYISIIVPVYNAVRYLRQCMDSLINQTLEHIEIICVNDGSTDQSLSILEEYAKRDKRIQIINQKNTGLSGARNAGILLATGDYLMFVDSDDWIDEKMCDVMFTKALKNQCDILSCTYIKEFGDHSVFVHTYPDDEFYCEIQGKIIQNLFGIRTEELSCPEQMDLPVSAWGKIFRRTIVQSVEFVDTKKIGTEDLLYLIETYNISETFGYIDIPFYHYRRSDYGTLTTTYMPDKFEKWNRLYDELLSIAENRSDSAICVQGLNNRIACNMIGLGLNEVLSTHTIKEESYRLKAILNHPRYDYAICELDTTYMQMHWKIFFFLCKTKWTFLLVVLLKLMEFLRKRIR